MILLLKPQVRSVTVAASTTGWPVTVGVVEVGVVDTSEELADAERQRYACLHCTHGLAGRGDGCQCALDLGRSSINREKEKYVVIYNWQQTVLSHMTANRRTTL